MLNRIKRLFKRQVKEKSKGEQYLEHHGLNLKCSNCGNWQSDVLPLEQSMDLHFNDPHENFDTLTCGGCNQLTTFFDTGFMGVRVAVDREKAKLGEIEKLPTKNELLVH